MSTPELLLHDRAHGSGGWLTQTRPVIHDVVLLVLVAFGACASPPPTPLAPPTASETGAAVPHDDDPLCRPWPAVCA